MSWASRRKFLYLFSIFSVIAVLVGVPVALWLYEPATCFDGILNQDETAVDRGGPCKLLDERTLIPHAVLWSRGFPVRDGLYSGVAYIENPNQGAGVAAAPYRFRLYDSGNVLINEVEDVTYVMPGAITPVFVNRINAGERIGTRAFFEFTGPLVWERKEDLSQHIIIENKRVTNTNTRPRLTATVINTAATDLKDVLVVATVFDVAGNAFAASSTVIPLLPADTRQEVIFTWSDAFDRRAARTDVLPSVAPRD